MPHAQPRMVPEMLFTLSAILAMTVSFVGTLSKTHAFVCSTGSVVITEFSSAGSPEWVELQNNGPSDLTLTGWMLRDMTFGDVPGTHDEPLNSITVPGGGVAVFTYSGSHLNNGGDALQLVDGCGEILSAVTYGTLPVPVSAPVSPVPAAGQSAQLIGTSWMVGTPTMGELNEPLATPTPTPSPTPTPDTIAPFVLSVTSPDADGFYRKGQTIRIEVRFSEPVMVTPYEWWTCGPWSCSATYAEYPKLTLALESNTRVLDYVSGSGSDTLLFTYAVQDDERTADLNYAAEHALVYNGREPGQVTLRDAAGNAAMLALPALDAPNSLAGQKDIAVDGTLRATVADLDGVSADGIYKPGDTIIVSVRFSETVTVSPYGWWTCGPWSCSATSYEYPKLLLRTGELTGVYATYVSGSGSDTLLFTYTVQADEWAVDLDVTDMGSLIHNSHDPSQATIFDVFGVPATLTVPDAGLEHSLGVNADIVVDGVAPILTIVGDNPVLIERGGAYRDDGAMAADFYYGDVEVQVQNPVDTAVVGDYTVTYTAIDAAGNSAQATRIVRVRDTLIGNAPIPSPEPTTSPAPSPTPIPVQSFGGGGGGTVLPIQQRVQPTPLPTPIPTPTVAGQGTVLGESIFMFLRNLRFGSRLSPDVAELQARLIAEGFLAIEAPTGYFGRMTLAAVKAYQKAHGIAPVSGLVGPLTRAALNGQ